MFDKELETLDILIVRFYKYAREYDEAAQGQPKGNDDDFVAQQLFSAAAYVAQAHQSLIAIRHRFLAP